MKRTVDVLVIGAGPAGLAAAASVKNEGVSDILIVEREAYPGGVLNQCIHNGFGLQRYKEELTGPEYAGRAIEEAAGIETYYSTAVLKLSSGTDGLSAFCLSAEHGALHIEAGAVILAMGCRERSRGAIAIPGTRPAGILTAGLAQKLVNMEGYLPGREVVILGSGDIGLIMARRMTWEGARVKAVVEIQPYAGGLLRNVVQCLDDFDIPLYLSHTITQIRGRDRIQEVDVSPLGASREPLSEKSFTISCDTLLLSVGLIPENELSREAGVELHPVTGGPVVDDRLMTTVPGIFACGNVLHVHDLADYVSDEAWLCGKNAAAHLKDKAGEAGMERIRIPVRSGAMIRYVLPMSCTEGRGRVFSLRPLDCAEHAVLTVRNKEKELYRRRLRTVHPASMVRLEVPDIPRESQYLEFSIEPKIGEGEGNE